MNTIFICEGFDTAKSIAERAPQIEYIKAIKLTENDQLIALWQK